MILVFMCVVSFSLVEFCDAACTSSDFTFNNLATFTGFTKVDTENPVAFLMEAPDYYVPDTCTCGVLYKWRFFAVNSGQLHLQVWNRDSNTLYTLKGENYYTVPPSLAGQQIEFQVPFNQRITVRNNYIIGWYSSSSGIVGYDDSNNDNIDTLKKATAVSDLNPGDTYGWQATAVQSLDNRNYAFGASVLRNTAPAFTNLPREMNIYTTWAANSFLYQVTVDDLDPDDVALLSVHIDTDSTTYFNYSTSDQRLYLARTSIPVGTYTVTFTVTDQCGNTNTGVFTVVVKNWPPSLTNLPNFTSISEDTTNEVELYRIQFSDMDNATLADSTALNVVTTPTSTYFDIKYYGENLSNRSIIVKQGSSFPYENGQYFRLQIKLTDNENTTLNGYFLVYIVKNDPPKITNLVSGTHVNISYETHRNDSFVFAVEATDAENDRFTSWTLDFCLPAPCPFYLDRDGVVYNTHDFIRTYEPGYDLGIVVRDLQTPNADIGILTVFITDINDKPVISNLPLTNPLVVLENTPLGTTVFTVLYRDFDPDDTHTIQAFFDETWARSYFNLNITTGILTTSGNVLDYEALVPYTTDWQFTMNITVSDGLDWDSQSLVINIGNVNEAPSFSQTRYSLEPSEIDTVGNSAGNPNWELNDPDLAVAALTETHTYAWDCGNNSRYFLMATDGTITFSEDFNLDTSDAIFPYDCVVTVTDKGGLTATTTLEIEVQDTNNNAPIFPQNSTYLIIQDPFLTPGRFVGQVTANDADRSTLYGKIYYSFLQVPVEFSESYLYINDLGNIYVNESWPTSLFDYGVTYELIVHAANAVDDTNTRLTATATVSLILPGTTTIYVTTTDRQAKFIEDNRNVAWITAEGALGLMLFLIICGLAMAYTIQTKRYRWCLPFFRKRFLGLKTMTDREKREYYSRILLEQMESSGEEESSSSSDELSEFSDDLPINPEAPPVWAKMKDWVPHAAAYDQPRPPLKRDISGLSVNSPDPVTSRIK